MFNQDTGAWERLVNRTFASATEVVRGSANGQRMNFASHVGTRQKVILANTLDNRATGRIEITDAGSIQGVNSPQFSLNLPLPQYWRPKFSISLGIPGPCTVNLHDEIADDDDIIRLKPGFSKIFVPARYNILTFLQLGAVNSLKFVMTHSYVSFSQNLLIYISM